MLGRWAALAAGLVAAAGATGAAVWARRRADDTAARRRQRRSAAGGRRESRAHGMPVPGTVPEPAAVPALGAMPEPAAEPEPAANPEPGSAVSQPDVMPDHGGVAGDRLQSLKGVGAVSADRLRATGVTTFAQIAAWDDEAIETVAARIKVSPERIRREDWVGQARTADSAAPPVQWSGGAGQALDRPREVR